MIVKNGKIIAIDKVFTDGVTLSGNGRSDSPLGYANEYKLTSALKEIDKTKNSITDLYDAINDIDTSIDNIYDSIDNIAKEVTALPPASAINNSLSAMNSLISAASSISAISYLIDDVSALNNEVSNINSTLEEYNSILNEHDSDIENIYSELSSFDEQINDIHYTVDQHTNEISNIHNEVSSISENITNISENINNITNIIEEHNTQINELSSYTVEEVTNIHSDITNITNTISAVTAISSVSSFIDVISAVSSIQTGNWIDLYADNTDIWSKVDGNNIKFENDKPILTSGSYAVNTTVVIENKDVDTDITEFNLNVGNTEFKIYHEDIKTYPSRYTYNQIINETDISGYLNTYLETENISKFDYKLYQNIYSLVNLNENISGSFNQATDYITHDIFVTTGFGDIKQYSTLTSGTKYEDIFMSAFNVYQAMNASISVSPNKTFEYPYPVTINTISINATAGSLPITEYAFKYDSYPKTSAETYIEPINADGKHSKTLTSAINFTTNKPTTFYGYISDGKNEKEISTSINFLWPYFYGLINEEDYDNIELPTGTKLLESKGSKTLSYNAKNKYIFIAYNSSYGKLKSIKDENNFENIDNFIILEKEYYDQTYYMYITNEVKTYNGKFTFSY